MQRTVAIAVGLLWGGAAFAQPAEPDAAPPPPPPEAPQPVAAPVPPPEPEPEPEPVSPDPARPAEPFQLPRLFTAPSGRLLPAAAIYSSSGLDTSGGFASDLRVGLGDVAEFGISLSDRIRARSAAGEPPRRLSPYFSALFKMGIAEDLLFAGQPALSLGFEKSFEHDDGAHDSRTAALSLVATRSLGERVAVHAGGVFWDALLIGPEGETLLHTRGVGRQLRPFGGVEVEPLPDAQILIETYWVPELRYEDPRIDLTALLAWGVRYRIGPVFLEAGVRVPDIADANLIEAQIFGQFTFVNRGIRRWLGLR